MSTARRQPVFKLGVVDLGIETAVLPGGASLQLAVIRHPGASAVVAVDGESRVVMLRQYRHAIGGYLWEIPAGCRNAGEDGRRCAERELLEETGLKAKQWDRIGAIVTIPSFCDERIEIFLARDLTASKPAPDDDEIIVVEWMDFDQALRMLSEGEIQDAKTIAALHLATPMLQRPAG